jgi:hypothetical protein
MARRIGRILTHPSCSGSVLATHGLLVRDPAPYLTQLAHEVDRAPIPPLPAASATQGGKSQASGQGMVEEPGS